MNNLNKETIYLAGLLEASSDAIFSRGNEGKIISWNKGAEKLFGLSKIEAIGNSCYELGLFNFSEEDINLIINNINVSSESAYYSVCYS